MSSNRIQRDWSPLVIVGAPRTGTNLLRDLLTQLPGYGTWPCDEINYIWRHGNATHPRQPVHRFDQSATHRVSTGCHLRLHRTSKDSHHPWLHVTSRSHGTARQHPPPAFPARTDSPLLLPFTQLGRAIRIQALHPGCSLRRQGTLLPEQLSGSDLRPELTDLT